MMPDFKIVTNPDGSTMIVYTGFVNGFDYSHTIKLHCEDAASAATLFAALDAAVMGVDVVSN